MKIKTLLTILCVYFSINLHSQEGEIIYTNFKPDSVIILSYSSYPFDVNYDCIPDFEFIEEGTSGGNYNLFQVLSDALYNFKVKKISIDDTIPLSDHIWKTSDWRIFMNTFSGNYRDYNVGIRQPIGDGNYCYAWMRLNFYYDKVVEKYKVSLYDMAYCTVPNYPLRVGQKSFDDTSINDTSEFKDYVLFPSPANDKITLKFNNHYYNTTDNEIKIYGIDGRLLKTQNSDFDNIDISNLTSGVYIMKIYLGNGENYTEKFVKE